MLGVMTAVLMPDVDAVTRTWSVALSTSGLLDGCGAEITAVSGVCGNRLLEVQTRTADGWMTAVAGGLIAPMRVSVCERMLSVQLLGVVRVSDTVTAPSVPLTVLAPDA